jgi:hypothetical protein
VDEIDGTASVRRGDAVDFHALRPNDPIHLGDTVQTGKRSKSFLKFEDGTIASLGEFSEVYVYDFEQLGRTQYFNAEVTAGVIRFRKGLPETSPPSGFTVSTPSAVINVEADGNETDFVVQVFNEKQTSVTVIRGRIRVRNASDELSVERAVRACQRADIDAEKSPSPAIGVSSETLKESIAETTIPGKLPEEVPACRTSYQVPIPETLPDEAPEEGVDVCVPPAIGMGWIDVPACTGCVVWDGESCIPCEWAGMECVRGRCVRKDCAQCTAWDGRRCRPCRDVGMECRHGRCVPPTCGPCRVWTGRRCVACRDLGLMCEAGECVRKSCSRCQIQRGSRCVPCGELGLTCRDGRCVRPYCPNCTIWNGRRCVSCTELGKVCLSGRCVRKQCPGCTVWNGTRCVPCHEYGMVCEGGKCVHRPCGPCEVRTGGRCVS